MNRVRHIRLTRISNIGDSPCRLAYSASTPRYRDRSRPESADIEIEG